MELYDIVYLLCNGLMSFTIYKFMRIFYAESKVSKMVEAIAYCLHFALVSTIYMLIPIPLLMLCSNLLLLFLCAQLYVGHLKKAVLVTLTIYITHTCIETLVVLLTSLEEIGPFTTYNYESVLGIITARIITFVLVFALKGIDNVKKHQNLPAPYWVSLFVVPISSLCMFVAVLTANSTTNGLVLVSVVGVFAINVLTFFLYDKVSALLYKQMDERLLAEQTRYHEKQLKMMKTSLEQIRILRHDLSNKLSPLLALSEERDMERVQTVVRELLQYTGPDKHLVSSGNLDIDSILNYKFEKGRQEGVQISTEIAVPNALSIASSDLAVMLGNLIDNALEGVSTASERWVEVKINYTKGLLMIEVLNSFDGVVLTKHGKLTTRKSEKKEHGLGLQSVEMVAQKYDGLLQTSYDDYRFQTKLLLYV